jgi:preprotein translocase subunit SecD
MPSVDGRNGVPEVYIAITLTPEAGERFAAFTRTRVNRRLAIVLDGRINSAPVIRTAIDGGRISITMGAYDYEKQMKDARALAAGLSQK